MFIRDRNGMFGLRLPLTVMVAFCMLVVSCRTVSTGASDEGTPADRPQVTPVLEKKIAEEELEFENDGVTALTNIHYTGKYCNECHEKIPAPGGERYLKSGGGYGYLCRCHGTSHDAYIHPFNMIPTTDKKERMPSDFPLENGRVTCLTCHDIYLQCQKSLFARNSLRGSPYSKRTDFCYKCHIEKNFEQSDPHLQLTESGEIIIETCLICHDEKPDEKHATFKDVTFIGNIELMCRRCHHIAGNHSGNHDHMGVKPSTDGIRRIKAMEERYNARLPLDEDGLMTCITCHNPHTKGVIPESNPGARGADSKYRHRLPEDMCKECHEM